MANEQNSGVASPQQQNEAKKESIGSKISSVFECLTDFSPLDGDNLILALFHSYLWNLTTHFVAVYWKFIATMIGIVHLLEIYLSPNVALVLQFVVVPLIFSYYLSLTNDSMNGQRRAVSLFVVSITNILQSVALSKYQLNFIPPPMFFAPFAYAMFVPLTFKWFGFRRDIVIIGTSIVLFVFQHIFAFVFNFNFDYFVWSAILCLASLITFQLKVGSLRADEAKCALSEGSGINVNALSVILLTMMYTTSVVPDAVLQQEAHEEL